MELLATDILPGKVAFTWTDVSAYSIQLSSGSSAFTGPFHSERDLRHDSRTKFDACDGRFIRRRLDFVGFRRKRAASEKRANV